MSRLRRLRRSWPVLAIAVVAGLVYAAWPGRSTFTVGPETTYATGPVDPEGFVDYPAALNERLAEGVTPETNANVLIVRALGPHPEGGTMPPEYYQRLEIDPPPEQGDYFLGFDKYYQAHLKGRRPEEPGGDWFTEFFGPEGEEIVVETDTQQRWQVRVDRYRQWPWTAKDQPEIADWLKQNEKPLAVLVEASKRSRYYNPLVARNADPHSARILNSLLPTVQRCREVARALACRAMLRLGEGDADAAWQDLLACHRLGHLLGRGGSLIEGLVGVAIVQIAANGELALVSQGRPSAKQALAWRDDLGRVPPMTTVADKMDLSERFMLLDILNGIAYHGPEFLGDVDQDGPPGARSSSNPFRGRLFRPSIDLDPAFRNVNRMFDRCAAAGRLPDRAARQAEYSKFEHDIRQLKLSLSQMGLLERAAWGKAERGEMVGNVVMTHLVPAFGKIQDAADRADQIERNLHVALALAAYRADAGRYPARLAELAPKYLPEVPGDLFSGGPLVWRPEGDGYLLYSVGVNGLDEDGRWTDDDPKG
ncbi:MAG: hypothetical protein J2P46_21365, partial [Zavarzinella sp.]|nr:hypothetical protein [Zavarzinella sp.]